MARLRLGVLISGHGSNLQALIDANLKRDFGAEVALVVSNQSDAYGLARARDAGLAAALISHRDYRTRDEFDAALDDALNAEGVELVCLAGFMRVLGTGFVERWKNRLINIHPSLLPAFKGLDVHRRVIAAGVRLSGCTVHYVRAEIDNGPIIVQGAVPVLAGDTAETLEARVHEIEHQCYPLAVDLIAKGRVQIEGECVRLLDVRDARGRLINPAPGDPKPA